MSSAAVVIGALRVRSAQTDKCINNINVNMKMQLTKGQQIFCLCKIVSKYSVMFLSSSFFMFFFQEWPLSMHVVHMYKKKKKKASAR